jgi:hypothetical protein
MWLVRQGITGILNEDLAVAIEAALRLEPDACRSFALMQSWERCTRQFLGHLAPIATSSRNHAAATPEKKTAEAL